MILIVCMMINGINGSSAVRSAGSRVKIVETTRHGKPVRVTDERPIPRAFTNRRAIVVSGGGIRAASGTFSLLKAFEDAGVDVPASFDYIVGLSGGAWAVAAYMLQVCMGDRTENANGAANAWIDRISGQYSSKKVWGTMFDDTEQKRNVKYGLGGGWIFHNTHIAPSWFHLRWRRAIEEVFFEKFLLKKKMEPLELVDMVCGDTGAIKPLFLANTCQPYIPSEKQKGKGEIGSYMHKNLCLVPTEGNQLECLRGMEMDSGVDTKQVTFPDTYVPLSPLDKLVSDASKVCYLKEYTERESFEDPNEFKDKVHSPRGGFEFYKLKDWMSSTGAAYIEARRDTDKYFMNLAPVRLFHCEPRGVSSGSTSSSSSASSSSSSSRSSLLRSAAELSNDDLFNDDETFRLCDAGVVCNLPLSFLQFREGEIDEVWMADYSLGDDPFAEVRKCIQVWRKHLYWTVIPTEHESGLMILDVHYYPMSRLKMPTDDMLDNPKAPFHTRVIVFPFFTDQQQFAKWVKRFPTQDQTPVSISIHMLLPSKKSPIGRPNDIDSDDKFAIFDELSAFYGQHADLLKVDSSSTPKLMGLDTQCLSPQMVLGAAPTVLQQTLASVLGLTGASVGMHLPGLGGSLTTKFSTDRFMEETGAHNKPKVGKKSVRTAISSLAATKVLQPKSISAGKSCSLTPTKVQNIALQKLLSRLLHPGRKSSSSHGSSKTDVKKKTSQGPSQTVAKKTTAQTQKKAAPKKTTLPKVPSPAARHAKYFIPSDSDISWYRKKMKNPPKPRRAPPRPKRASKADAKVPIVVYRKKWKALAVKLAAVKGMSGEKKKAETKKLSEEVTTLIKSNLKLFMKMFVRELGRLRILHRRAHRGTHGRVVHRRGHRGGVKHLSKKGYKIPVTKVTKTPVIKMNTSKKSKAATTKVNTRLRGTSK